jgi:hypothetical protein
MRGKYYDKFERNRLWGYAPKLIGSVREK